MKPYLTSEYGSKSNSNLFISCGISNTIGNVVKNVRFLELPDKGQALNVFTKTSLPRYLCSSCCIILVVASETALPGTFSMIMSL